jgi:hypothetical protein
MENKSDKIRSILVIAVFVVIVGGFFILSRATAPPAIIRSERRVPARLPALSVRTVTSGEYMDKFESFAADSFPLRESLRTLHAATVFGVFLQNDKNGLYFDTKGA